MIEYVIPAAYDLYDPTRIKQVSLYAWAGPGSCDEAACTWTQPTVLEIDSIEYLNAPAGAPGPYLFNANRNPLGHGSYMPIPNASLTWIP